jgi:hypothetical protein
LTFKKVSPTYIQGCPMTNNICMHAEEILHAGICDCVYYNPRIPSNMLKNLKDARVNPPPPPELVKCRMYVHWREREHEDIDNLVREDPDATAALA